MKQSIISKSIFIAILFTLQFICSATRVGTQNEMSGKGVWNPDRGRSYVNPIINADYSDPDVCRAGDDYYMTSSSFNCFPGLQILHSTDLVNWEIIGAALTDYPGGNWDDDASWTSFLPGEAWNNESLGADQWRAEVQHGNGVWAPSIRYHNGEFYIYCGDPDRGVFMVKSKDPAGPWEPVKWVVKAKGFIDPCPLWDEDGKAYLSHGCAGSRAGVKSVLFVAPMSEDGTRLIGPSRIVYDGHRTQPTIEGTKFYKRNGYYYIFSPAGGVPTGWQVALRSKSPYGPYEEKVVMAQGRSNVNGPHQGAWVSTQNDEDWFIHFQDKDAYGRVVHLQPMKWVNDWPVIGTDKDGDGVGEPVSSFRKPNLPSSGVFSPAESDEFSSTSLGLQWQWHGIPSPYWSYNDASAGILRLYSVHCQDNYRNLSDCPNLLLQKFPDDAFTMTAKVSFVPNPQLKDRGERAGMVVIGRDYSALQLVDTDEGVFLYQTICKDALRGSQEQSCGKVKIEGELFPEPYSARYMSVTVPEVPYIRYVSYSVYLRLEVRPVKREGNVPDARCLFSYSIDGKHFTAIGEEFSASCGKWIGAKAGFFCNRFSPKNDSGWLDVDWVRFSE